MRRTWIVLGALLAVAGSPLAATEREYIYGAELMSAQEREAYRRALQAAPNDAARDDYRRRHRERLQERARARGATLDEKGIVRRERER